MPPFPRKLLADHEKIVFDLKPHWIALAAPVAWTALFIAVWIVGYRLLDGGGSQDTMRWILSVLALAGIFYFSAFPAAKWATTHFVLTTDRLITRHGIIAKHSREIPLERINDVAFSQSILERFLGAGDLMIESAGERGQSRITNVRKPEDVQLMIYKETEANNNRMLRPDASASAPGATPGAQTVTDQIEALARLKDQGALTDLEFEEKKSELLKRL
jgi:uncharacterized membrane protein YdbT with pleckstrin-like domain